MVLTSLINDLAERDTPVVLVLDDCHEITAQAVHDMLIFMLDHLPPQIHLVVATRVDPPWPLARLRARQEMVELRSQDLRFSRDESSAFFNQVMELKLSAGSIAVLDARTEGWIAGLQMAALSLQGREVKAGASFVQAFNWSRSCSDCPGESARSTSMQTPSD